MTTIYRSATTVGAIVWLVFLSDLTVRTGVPTVWSPLNLLVVIPMFLVGPIICLAVMPVTFCFWCGPVLRGNPIVPTRSVVLLVSVVALSAISFVADAEFALNYHGRNYLFGAAVISALWWLFLGVLAFAARRSPGSRLNLLFHLALFSWLAWYAVPYLGELP